MRDLPQLVVEVHGAHTHGVVALLAVGELHLLLVLVVHPHVPLHEPLLALARHLHCDIQRHGDEGIVQQEEREHFLDNL